MARPVTPNNSQTAWGATARNAWNSTSDKVDDLGYNIADYGALGTWDGSTGSDDTAALTAALADLQSGGSGGSIFFPPLPTGRYYRFTSALPNISGVKYCGLSRDSTRLWWTTTNVFTITGTLRNVTFEGLSIQTSAGHVFDLGNGITAALNNLKVQDCAINILGNAHSIVRQINGTGAYTENMWLNCELSRPSTSTVPAFNISNSASTVNNNVWKRVRANSNNNTSTPFFYLEANTDA